MDTRKRLGCHDSEISSGYDKNQKLTGILRQNTRSGPSHVTIAISIVLLLQILGEFQACKILRGDLV